MINEFDKEIDAILRKMQSEPSATAAGLSTHLDADEISAFAENALPENAKMRSIAHFADCDRCRKILSNLILLNAEPASEFVHAEEAAASIIPWYQKLFAVPKMAYALGALVMIFGAMIAFTVLQTSTLKNAEVSQTGETTLESKSAPATAANVPLASAPANSAFETESNTTLAANNSVDLARALPKPAPNEKSESNFGLVSEDNKPLAVQPSDSAKNKIGAGNAEVSQPLKNEAQRADRDEAKDDESALKGISPAASGALNQDARKKAMKEADAKERESINIGGKTFRREGDAWIDSAYQRGSNMMLPPLKYVSRGSSEYKKLDGDLRKIAEKLKGVVIVVWKSKAYRIQ